MDSREICQKLESWLGTHPNAALPIAAEKLGFAREEIEKALREFEGKSYDEFRQSLKLAEAFKQLGADRTAPPGPWGKMRSGPRRIIPRTTVQYRIRGFWFFGKGYSNPCPLVDLSSGGMAFLADAAPLPGRRVSLLLKFPEREGVRVEGNVVYAVASGVAGYRRRIGIQFLPFEERRGCNSPKVLDALTQIGPK